MKSLCNILLPQPEFDRFCQQWKIAELYFFGSVLREDFRSDSDIDVMVSFAADAPWGTPGIRANEARIANFARTGSRLSDEEFN